MAVEDNCSETLECVFVGMKRVFLAQRLSFFFFPFRICVYVCVCCFV